MSTITLVWILIFTTPNEAAGRQAGPFPSEALCIKALQAYAAPGYNRTGVCVQSIR
jgi:hypothetical protein